MRYPNAIDINTVRDGAPRINASVVEYRSQNADAGGQLGVEGKVVCTLIFNTCSEIYS